MSLGSRSARLAVDIGGTFTDIALIAGGELYIRKVLTTHDAPQRGFLEGMSQVLAAAALEPADLGLLLHGTTLATNALIERRGARVALVTTQGFRDVLEIADEGRFDQYDLTLRKPPPLVPRSLRFTVAERMDSEGRIIRPLDVSQLPSLVAQLERSGAESIAIGLIHAYRNPEHERRIRDYVAARLPGPTICISSEVCPEIREYERISTTCANAYVRPLMQGYLQHLAQALAQLGVTCPLLLMTSSGGLCSVTTAQRFPIRLVESGPAGGASLATRIATQAGLRSVVSFDMGGTTAKICLLEGSQPETARRFEVARAARFRKGSGLPLQIPVIEMIEIGAGGGSIAGVDRLRNINVGPESAGSEPGPACYARGGELPTVTDADLILGRLGAAGFAGGTIELQRDLAGRAIDEQVGHLLELDTKTAAFGICETIDETMTNAARVYAVERGKDLARHTMIAFGGAAPLHAARMAEKLHIDRIIVPPNAGVGSALGFLCAPVSYENVRSHYMPLAAFAPAALNQIFGALNAEAETALRDIVDDRANVTEERVAYMRYSGQGHEVPVSLPHRPYENQDVATFRELFEMRYRALFGRILPDAAIEILTLGLRIAGEGLNTLEDFRQRRQWNGSREAAGMRAVFLPSAHGFRNVPVHERSALPPGVPHEGPCVVTEETTTTFVTPGFEACVDEAGNLVLQRRRI